MASKVSEVLVDLDSYLNNPGRIQQIAIDQALSTMNGELDIVDPTNPAVMVMESASVLTAAAAARFQKVLRNIYPTQAQEYKDLYQHMSDRDYDGRFALPAKSKFCLMFGKDELLSRMVLDPETNTKKLVIPRNSYFKLNDIVFGIEYPIEIRQLAHGELHIVYDTSIESPIQELSTNIVNFEERVGPDSAGSESITWVWMEFDVLQFSLQSQLGDLNASVRFVQNIPLTDQYFYTRVYLMNDDGSWQEIQTTHSALVYDIDTPTAVLEFTPGNIKVSIPEIYAATGNNTRKVRIDTYETKGPLNMQLGNYPNTAFEATWRAIDVSERTVYVAPLEEFNQLVVFSNSLATGGRNELSFEELKKRVINNSLSNIKLPISPAQIQANLEDDGYQIVQGVDVITDRVFLATRELPQPSQNELITPAAASIQTALFKVQDIVSLGTVIDNGDSVTITPDTIYQNKNGQVSFVPTATVQAILALSPENQAIKVNDAGYYYTPFHYVLDLTGNEFAVRPYYLDNPVAESMVFKDTNDKTGLWVTIDSYKVSKTPTGYQLTISTTSSEEFKALDDDEVYVQIAYTPVGERDRAYQNGVLVNKTDTGERLFTFDLSTNFNVTKDNSLELEKFLMYTTDPKITPSKLFQEFDILFATSRAMPSTWSPNGVDDILGRFLLPPEIAAITHEIIRVRFGYFLERLWARARSVPSTEEYQRYTTDIPMLYENDVYEKDPQTGSEIIIVNGEVTMNLLHAKGTPVLDAQGNQVYLHRKGDVILDASTGEPIVINPRGMFRQVDFMLLEGVYWFATDSVATAYRQELTNTLLNWITEGLTDIQTRLLDQTHIYFYPKTTTGLIEVMVNDGVVVNIEAGQNFEVTLLVSKTVDQNEPLKDALKRNMIQVISNELMKSTVARSRIIDAAVDVFGDDVIDTTVKGLGGLNRDYSAMTVLTQTDRPNIRKRLVAQPDGFLIVEEAVDFTFVRHEQL